jgi:hypothetical protein
VDTTTQSLEPIDTSLDTVKDIHNRYTVCEDTATQSLEPIGPSLDTVKDIHHR